MARPNTESSSARAGNSSIANANSIAAAGADRDRPPPLHTVLPDLACPLQSFRLVHMGGYRPVPQGRLQELRIWVPPELYERVLRDAAVRKASLSRCICDRLELCYEIEADWADALEAVPPAGKAGAAVLRHKILDAMEERLAATLEQHALRLQESAAVLRRVESMCDHLALWLFVLLPAPRQREMEDRQQQGRQSHGRWRLGVRRLVEDGGPGIERLERKEPPR
jgi:hypothetical protein